MNKGNSRSITGTQGMNSVELQRNRTVSCEEKYCLKVLFERYVDQETCLNFAKGVFISNFSDEV